MLYIQFKKTHFRKLYKQSLYFTQEDYRQAVQELDEKEFITLRLCCCELRNHYVSTQWLFFFVDGSVLN